jgi:hypothetical protein
MFFSDRSKQYPHLVQYLKTVDRESKEDRIRREMPTGLMIGGIAGAIGFLAFALISKQWLPIIGTGVFGLMGVWGHLNRWRSRKSEITLAREPALPQVHSLLASLENRRLHRDLDYASLTLLEECAHQWFRVQQAFAGNDMRATTYGIASSQAAVAAEAGMAEVLGKYRAQIPEEVGPRKALDFVDEALETFVFKGRSEPQVPPHAFYESQQIAEKLRELADVAESLAQSSGPKIPMAGNPGSLLDHSIGELRTIRDAEQELQQDLRQG